MYTSKQPGIWQPPKHFPADNARPGYVLERDFRIVLDEAAAVVDSLSKTHQRHLIHVKNQLVRRYYDNRREISRLEECLRLAVERPTVYQRLDPDRGMDQYILKHQHDRICAQRMADVFALGARQQAEKAKSISAYEMQKEELLRNLSKSEAEKQVDRQAFDLAWNTEYDLNEELRRRLKIHEPGIDHHRIALARTQFGKISPIRMIACPMLKHSFIDIRMVKERGQADALRSLTSQERRINLHSFLAVNVTVHRKIDNFRYLRDGQPCVGPAYVFECPREEPRFYIANDQQLDDSGIDDDDHSQSVYTAANHCFTETRPAWSAPVTGISSQHPVGIDTSGAADARETRSVPQANSEDPSRGTAIVPVLESRLSTEDSAEDVENLCQSNLHSTRSSLSTSAAVHYRLVDSTRDSAIVPATTDVILPTVRRTSIQIDATETSERDEDSTMQSQLICQLEIERRDRSDTTHEQQPEL